MLKNHLKIAFRNIWKNKFFSAIHIIGLSIGLSAAFVIGVIIYYDMTFDTFHPDADRIYRVTTDFTTPVGNFHNRGVAVPLAEALDQDVPGIELVTSFFNTRFQKVENKATGRIFKSPDDMIYAQGNYFDLIHYDWLVGTPNGVLSSPNEVVLTETRAAQYFPNTPLKKVLGSVLTYNDSIPVEVVGVVSDFQKRTDFVFKEFLSFKTAISAGEKEKVFNKKWNSTNSGTQIFIKLEDHQSLGIIQNRLDAIAKANEDEQIRNTGQERSFNLQPLSDLHFNPNYGIFNNVGHLGNKNILIGLSLAALFLLLLACINFINLNTAQATKRSMEIGIRKTLGSSRKQLVLQFMGETFLLTSAAALVSLALSPWLLHMFVDFIPKGVDYTLFYQPQVLLSIAGLLVLVSLLSGFYPALFQSRFQPISVLKNRLVSGESKWPLRKYLTIFQFIIAQIFIVATLFVGKQLNYVMKRDMGFKTEANVYIRGLQVDDFGKRNVFAEKLRSFPQISEVSMGGPPPASSNMFASTFTFIKDESKIHTDVELLFGDLNYRKLYDINLLAGRARLNDTIGEYVINQTYARLLGFENPNDAIGHMLKVNDKSNPIVGVMEDFNQRSLRSAIKPMALVGDRDRKEYSQFNIIHFSLQDTASEKWSNVIADIEETWKSLYPQANFDLHFMDDTIKRFYEQERKTTVLLNWATGLAILISCLGLLGLVIHTTERRTKEIGVRKVLGASLGQLNLLLCKEFLILVAIAFVIAAPIAWWGVSNWLQGFAYKTQLNWWVFVLSVTAMLLIALAIISIRTIAAANANPIKSLRME
ncbi:ABC transporter permease [Flagellimonas eckloniae]|uniref:Cell division protein FtsX n=1 Tax=Flagellimonas eckloniae TaxID=346185 RepID=A0A0Q0XNQ1_9FLAO|nr:FtsX-like permease family protein [Allomuricauda eckloniae]KQC30674.1 cell division protein FtsX [Allomuricauda eckloniae]